MIKTTNRKLKTKYNYKQGELAPTRRAIVERIRTYLMEPHRRHDEEKLDADSTERQNATESNAEGRVSVPHLIGNVSSDLVGAHWHLNGILLETKIASNKHQRSRNTEPKQHQRQQRCERSSCGRAIEGNEDVDRAEQHSDNSRIE